MNLQVHYRSRTYGQIDAFVVTLENEILIEIMSMQLYKMKFNSGSPIKKL